MKSSPLLARGAWAKCIARDTNLARDVAIKVLPEAFAHDPERLSCFRREAKILVALNHPNIATIYGLEQSAGTSYLVIELVPGETLRECIRRDGEAPIEKALTIARQIAGRELSALSAKPIRTIAFSCSTIVAERALSSSAG
jgi:serine/threonine protein kinase